MSRVLTITLYILIALIGVGMQLASRRPGSRIPSLGRVFGRAMRTRAGRVGITAGWAWLGMHLLSR